jgi:hypothetical protein
MTEPVPLDWQNLPNKRTLNEMLARLEMSADAKVLIGKVIETTAQIGGRLVDVGRTVVAFTLDLARRYPGTTFGLIIGAAVSYLISTVPLIGPFIASFMGPLMIAFGISVGAIADLLNGAVHFEMRRMALAMEQQARG